MPLDPEIFGSSSQVQTSQVQTARDDDIFKDMPQEPAGSSAKMEAKPDYMAIATNPKLPRKERFDAYMQADREAAANGVYDLGGAVTDLTGSPAAGGITHFLANAVPALYGANLSPALAKPVLNPIAEFLMRSAMKPTLTQVRKGQAAPAVRTMLEEGFNPTASGVEKMKATVGELSDQVKQSIAHSGARISTGAVADYVPNAYQRFANGPTAAQAVEDLGQVQRQFLEHPNVLAAKEIPVQVAQEMKSGYQKAIGDKGYGELKSATTEGEKQVARGLRELIGEAVPSVQEPLKREADIIKALKIAERRVAVDANKNPIGLGWLGQPWMIPFWMWDRSALAKSLTARALHSAAGPALAGASAPLAPQLGALYQLYQSAIE